MTSIQSLPSQQIILSHPISRARRNNCQVWNNRRCLSCFKPKSEIECKKSTRHLRKGIDFSEPDIHYEGFYTRCLADSGTGGMSASNNVDGSKLGNNHRRDIDKSETLQEDPYGIVESAMSSPVVTTTPEATLDSILEYFQYYTGLPVVDESGRCVGMISNIDVAKYLQGKAASLQSTQVRDVMTTPAIVILKGAHIAYAAGLMLKHKIHRLPVVDNDGTVVGIVSRTNLFEPLTPKTDMIYHMMLGKNKRLNDDW